MRVLVGIEFRWFSSRTIGSAIAMAHFNRI